MHAEFRPVVRRTIRLGMLLWRLGHSGIEDQAIKAIDAHIKLGEQGCGEYELIKIEIA